MPIANLFMQNVTNFFLTRRIAKYSGFLLVYILRVKVEYFLPLQILRLAYIFLFILFVNHLLLKEIILPRSELYRRMLDLLLLCHPFLDLDSWTICLLQLLLLQVLLKFCALFTVKSCPCCFAELAAEH